jgi:hypothetical protein
MNREVNIRQRFAPPDAVLLWVWILAAGTPPWEKFLKGKGMIDV